RYQGNPGNHPRLLQEFANLEWPPEARTKSVPSQLDKTAYGAYRNRELFNQACDTLVPEGVCAAGG
ncbi:MAG TPA: hypothetical protein VFR60_00450, partial [Sphingomicrobium sp.]|nr:hypothetical protein [Sphingomicrobium sp.]